ncbi:cobalt transporter CbiM [Planctomycetota bacterium]
MHISEGVLSAPVWAGGACATAAGVAYGLRRTDYDRIPQVAVLSSAFFVASLIHVPIGPSNAHLVLNGLAGLLLGWAVFPAVFVGLVLQAILFQFGGLTTLGINTVNMALPGLICYFLFGRWVRGENGTRALAAAFLCGSVSVFLSALMTALALVSTGEAFTTVSRLLVVAHVPVMVVEGILTAFCVRFLRRVKPEILEVPHAM